MCRCYEGECWEGRLRFVKRAQDTANDGAAPSTGNGRLRQVPWTAVQDGGNKATTTSKGKTVRVLSIDFFYIFVLLYFAFLSFISWSFFLLVFFLSSVVYYLFLFTSILNLFLSLYFIQFFFIIFSLLLFLYNFFFFVFSLIFFNVLIKIRIRGRKVPVLKTKCWLHY